MKRISAFLLVIVMLFTMSACGTDTQNNIPGETSESTDASSTNSESAAIEGAENFVLVKGGEFEMGSPDTEAWRSDDEMLHTVTVSDFYMSIYELTQKEYREIMGENPSSFSGDELPVENISWMDAVRYCNARSEKENLTPAYTVDGQNVTWDRSANGYRLPTEAEWEYACRAGTATPFNTENSISAEEANYYGHYPYEIEDNYFSQGNLSTKPGEYRQTTVPVNSFSPNKWGLYNMHGNVSEWVWDYYGAYSTEAQRDQNAQARPEIKNHVENMEQYDAIILGYPNWWASIPMPIATFLEEYDFSGKTIIPFCSHGGGRFGQSLTAIAKLAPDAAMGEALSVHYSGGGSLSSDVSEWLETNGIN